VRALFFGTPDIAVPSLEALHGIAEVKAVVCQPDRPAGRGLKLRPPPVKTKALELGLDVVQPEKVRRRAFVDWVAEQDVDVVLVIAYGKILGPRLLGTPRRGCINLHASLLPRYRGAAPINWAVVHGETETGISRMQMDVGMDTGPVFSRHVIPIGPNATAGALYAELGKLAADVVRSDLARAVAGELVAEPQDDALATEAPMLKREDGLVDWSKRAPEVHDHVRGMTPWPGAHSLAGGKRIKILATELAQPDGERGAPGEIVAIEQQGAEIACGTGSVWLSRAQLEGKKALPVADLARGRALTVGQRLGSQ
jgi:methionyl-tRNA formyltransferase